MTNELDQHLVAVYGTLRQGGIYHDVMENAGGVFLGGMWTPPEYTMYSLTAYPAVTLDGGDSIYLEVYLVEDMSYIDTLEGYPHLYTRDKISTPWGKAWIYHMDPETLPNSVEIVMSGDWLSFIENPRLLGDWTDATV